MSRYGYRGWRAPTRGPEKPNPFLVRAELHEANAKWPVALVEVKQRIVLPPVFNAIPAAKRPARSWRSKDWLVQEFRDDGDHRLMIVRLDLDYDLNLVDKATFADLMRLKAEAGFADHHAIEIYPPEASAPVVPQVRFLKLFKEPPPSAESVEPVPPMAAATAERSYRVTVQYTFAKKKGGVSLGLTVKAASQEEAMDKAIAQHVTPYKARKLHAAKAEIAP